MAAPDLEALNKRVTAVSAAVASGGGLWSRAGRWARATGLLLLVLAVAAVSYLVVFSGDVVNEIHRRNYNDLAVAANGLETWPADLKRLAQNNFTGKRLLPATSLEQREGWDRVAVFEHPDLGNLRLLFDIDSYGKAKSCGAGAFDQITGRPTPSPAFVRAQRPGAGHDFVVAGRIHPDEIWAADMDAAKPAVASSGLVSAAAKSKKRRTVAVSASARAEAVLRSVGGSASKSPSGDLICFRASVDLDRLVALSRTGRDFSHLLITDLDGRIFAVTGRERLPISALGTFKPSSLSFFGLLGLAPAPAGGDLQLKDLRGPAEVEISNETYTVYARPFELPGEPAACRAAPALGAARVTEAGKPATKAASADATAFGTGQTADTKPGPPAPMTVPQTCYAVALMPTATAWAHWLQAPPLLVTGFALAVLAALALLPALRLMLIGGNDSVHGIEVLGVLAGVQMAAALAVIAALFSADIVHERAVARDATKNLAESMSRSAEAEIVKAVVAIATELPRINDKGPNQPRPTKKIGTYPEVAPDVVPMLVGGKLLNGDILPRFESLAYFTSEGKPSANTRVLAWREGITARSDISRRGYFIDLLRGRFSVPINEKKSDAPAYTIAQVRAQTDGINKTVFALLARADANGAIELLPDFPPDYNSATDRVGAILAPTELRTLTSPVLPQPQNFMVVNADLPQLPVIFHSERDRAGVEEFAERLAGKRDLATRLAALRGAGAVAGFGFESRYDGRLQHFFAAPVPGTPWVLLTFHAIDDVDAVVAHTTTWALMQWSAIGLPALFMLFCIIHISQTDKQMLLPWRSARPREPRLDGRPRWQQFWPHENASPVYRATSPIMFLIAGGVLAAIIVGDALDHSAIGIIACSFGALTTLGIAGHRLTSVAPSGASLSPATQKHFFVFAAALLTCTAILPSLAFWCDARAFAHDRQNIAAIAAYSRAEFERSVMTNGIRRAFGMRSVKLVDQVGVYPKTNVDSATTTRPAVLHSAATTIRPESALHTPRDKISTWLWRSVSEVSPADTPATCVGEIPGAKCIVGKVLSVTVAPRPFVPIDDFTPVTGFAFFMFLAVLAVGLALLLQSVLRALFGFGVPLSAVTLPRLLIGASSTQVRPGWQALGARTLLIGPQRAVRDKVGDPADAVPIDLVTATAAAPADPAVATAISKGSGTLAVSAAANLRGIDAWSGKPRLVVTGLELVLRDPGRRRDALSLLEGFAGHAGPKRELVVIAELAPMDRILDAFEAEKVLRSTTGDDSERHASQKQREELRWARLFQEFAAFTFKPIDKIDNSVAMRLLNQHMGDPDRCPVACREGAATLIDELRWLSGNVIDSVINKEPVFPDLATFTEFPIAESIYRDAYTLPVTEWAIAIRPSSRAAAIDYLRGAAIEHFQQCWSASSHSERLVLDAIANGRFVNMAGALAMQSLVRRGLVVLDPAPRLMCESFALFVRQAERPDTLEEYRKEQPNSGWAAARLPVGVALAAMVVMLAAIARGSGHSLGTLTPILAAGGPALAATIGNLLKRG